MGCFSSKLQPSGTPYSSTASLQGASDGSVPHNGVHAQQECHDIILHGIKLHGLAVAADIEAAPLLCSRLVVAQGHVLAAVFEGHVLSNAAQYCRSHCWEAFIQAIGSRQHIPAAATLRALDRGFLTSSATALEARLTSGCSATLVHIDLAARSVTVATVGAAGSVGLGVLGRRPGEGAEPDGVEGGEQQQGEQERAKQRAQPHRGRREDGRRDGQHAQACSRRLRSRRQLERVEVLEAASAESRRGLASLMDDLLQSQLLGVAAPQQTANAAEAASPFTTGRGSSGRGSSGASGKPAAAAQALGFGYAKDAVLMASYQQYKQQQRAAAEGSGVGDASALPVAVQPSGRDSRLGPARVRCGCDVRVTVRPLFPGDECLVVLAGGGMPADCSASSSGDGAEAGPANGLIGAARPRGRPVGSGTGGSSGGGFPHQCLHGSVLGAVSVTDAVLLAHAMGGAAASASATAAASSVHEESNAPEPSGARMTVLYDSWDGLACGRESASGFHESGSSPDTVPRGPAGQAAAAVAAYAATAAARSAGATGAVSGGLSPHASTGQHPRTAACITLWLDWAAAARPSPVPSTVAVARNVRGRTSPSQRARVAAVAPAPSSAQARWELLRCYCDFRAARRRCILSAWLALESQLRAAACREAQVPTAAANAQAQAGPPWPMTPSSAWATTSGAAVQVPSLHSGASHAALSLGGAAVSGVYDAVLSSAAAPQTPMVGRSASFTSRAPVMMEFVEEHADRVPSSRGAAAASFSAKPSHTLARTGSATAGAAEALDAALTTGGSGVSSADPAAMAARLDESFTATVSSTAASAAAAAAAAGMVAAAPMGVAVSVAAAGVPLAHLGDRRSDAYDDERDSLSMIDGMVVGSLRGSSAGESRCSQDGDGAPEDEAAAQAAAAAAAASAAAALGMTCPAPVARRAVLLGMGRAPAAAAFKGAHHGSGPLLAAYPLQDSATDGLVHSSPDLPIAAPSPDGCGPDRGSGGSAVAVSACAASPLGWALATDPGAAGAGPSSAGHTPIPSAAALRLHPASLPASPALADGGFPLAGTRRGSRLSSVGAGVAAERDGGSPRAAAGSEDCPAASSGTGASPFAAYRAGRAAQVDDNDLLSTPGLMLVGSAARSPGSDPRVAADPADASSSSSWRPDDDDVSADLPPLRIESTAELAALMAEIVIGEDGEVIQLGGLGGGAGTAYGAGSGRGPGGLGHKPRRLSRQGSRGWQPRLAIVKEDARESHTSSSFGQLLLGRDGRAITAITEERGSSGSAATSERSSTGNTSGSEPARSAASATASAPTSASADCGGVAAEQAQPGQQAMALAATTAAPVEEAALSQVATMSHSPRCTTSSFVGALQDAQSPRMLGPPPAVPLAAHEVAGGIPSVSMVGSAAMEEVLHDLSPSLDRDRLPEGTTPATGATPTATAAAAAVRPGPAPPARPSLASLPRQLTLSLHRRVMGRHAEADRPRSLSGISDEQQADGFGGAALLRRRAYVASPVAGAEGDSDGRRPASSQGSDDMRRGRPSLAVFGRSRSFLLARFAHRHPAGAAHSAGSHAASPHAPSHLMGPHHRHAPHTASALASGPPTSSRSPAPAAAAAAAALESCGSGGAGAAGSTTHGASQLLDRSWSVGSTSGPLFSMLHSSMSMSKSSITGLTTTATATGATPCCTSAQGSAARLPTLGPMQPPLGQAGPPAQASLQQQQQQQPLASPSAGAPRFVGPLLPGPAADNILSVGLAAAALPAPTAGTSSEPAQAADAGAGAGVTASELGSLQLPVPPDSTGVAAPDSSGLRTEPQVLLPAALSPGPHAPAPEPPQHWRLPPTGRLPPPSSPMAPQPDPHMGPLSPPAAPPSPSPFSCDGGANRSSYTRSSYSRSDASVWTSTSAWTHSMRTEALGTGSSRRVGSAAGTHTSASTMAMSTSAGMGALGGMGMGAGDGMSASMNSCYVLGLQAAYGSVSGTMPDVSAQALGLSTALGMGWSAQLMQGGGAAGAGGMGYFRGSTPGLGPGPGALHQAPGALLPAPGLWAAASVSSSGYTPGGVVVGPAAAGAGTEALGVQAAASPFLTHRQSAPTRPTEGMPAGAFPGPHPTAQPHGPQLPFPRPTPQPPLPAAPSRGALHRLPSPPDAALAASPASASTTTLLALEAPSAPASATPLMHLQPCAPLESSSSNSRLLVGAGSGAGAPASAALSRAGYALGADPGRAPGGAQQRGHLVSPFEAAGAGAFAGGQGLGGRAAASVAGGMRRGHSAGRGAEEDGEA